MANKLPGSVNRGRHATPGGTPPGGSPFSTSSEFWPQVCAHGGTARTSPPATFTTFDIDRAFDLAGIGQSHGHVSIGRKGQCRAIAVPSVHRPSGGWRLSILAALKALLWIAFLVVTVAAGLRYCSPPSTAPGWASDSSPDDDGHELMPMAGS